MGGDAVGAPDRGRGAPERDRRERDDGELTPRRMQERHGQDDRREPHRVEPALQPQRLDLGAVTPPRRPRLVRVLPRIPERIDDQQGDGQQEPLRPETEGPRERHALQIAEEERRITQRRQHAADVAHEEGEEDHRVLDAPALAIGLQ